MVAAAVKKGAKKGKDQIEGAVVFCFKHSAYAVTGEEATEVMGPSGRRGADLKAGGKGLLLNSGDDSGGVLENGGADQKRESLRMGGAGRDEEGC